MNYETTKCIHCNQPAAESRGTGFYLLANKVYCSLNCYTDSKKTLGKKLIEGLKEAIKHDKGEIKLKETRRYFKTSKRPQANKSNKRSKKVQPKRKQQKARKTK